MARRYELTASEWNRIKDYLPPERSTQKGRPQKDNRMMLNGILWILRTGCQWRELPECYGSWQSVYARFRKWQKDGIFEKIFRELNLDADTEYIRINSASVKAQIPHRLDHLHAQTRSPSRSKSAMLTEHYTTVVSNSTPELFHRHNGLQA